MAKVLFLALFCWRVVAGPTVAGHEVQEDEGISSGAYIAPNEWDFPVYKNNLQGKKGALVSVGTFRTLFLSGFGDFEHVVMVDIDTQVTAYNRANLARIASSADRFDYLAKLYQVTPPPEVLAAARNGSITSTAFLQRIRNSSPKTEIEALVERNLRELAATDNWEETYLGSDKTFETLKRKIVEGRFSVVTADISSEPSMKSIANALRAAKLEVTAVDYSNVLDYVIPGRLGRDRGRQVAKNLGALPLSPSASLLFTHGRRGGWDHFALPAVDGPKLIAGLAEEPPDFRANMAKLGIKNSPSRFHEIPAVPDFCGSVWSNQSI